MVYAAKHCKIQSMSKYQDGVGSIALQNTVQVEISRLRKQHSFENTVSVEI